MESFKPSHNYNHSLQLFHGSMLNIMGTRFEILIVDQSESLCVSVWTQVVSELRFLQQMFNRFYPLSEISIINNEAYSKPIKASPEMWTVLQNCRKYYELTLGLFDITLNDFSKIEFLEESKSISFSCHTTKIDFGGYAKGYALNKIKNILIEHYVSNCFVDFGNSSILAMGKHPHGDSWKVSIENPFDTNQILAEVELYNKALSVSGNTPSYSGHIIRPDSMEYMVEPKLVCIASENPEDVEVLTTSYIIANNNEKNKLTANIKNDKILEFNL